MKARAGERLARAEAVRWRNIVQVELVGWGGGVFGVGEILRIEVGRGLKPLRPVGLLVPEESGCKSGSLLITIIDWSVFTADEVRIRKG
jgi:hypothetical protein